MSVVTAGAGARIRTADLLITSEPLYRLSYTGLGQDSAFYRPSQSSKKQKPPLARRDIVATIDRPLVPRSGARQPINHQGRACRRGVPDASPL